MPNLSVTATQRVDVSVQSIVESIRYDVLEKMNLVVVNGRLHKSLDPGNPDRVREIDAPEKTHQLMSRIDDGLRAILEFYGIRDH